MSFNSSFSDPFSQEPCYEEGADGLVEFYWAMPIPPQSPPGGTITTQEPVSPPPRAPTPTQTTFVATSPITPLDAYKRFDDPLPGEMPIIPPREFIDLQGRYERTTPLTYGDLFTYASDPQYRDKLFLPRHTKPVLKLQTHWVYPDGQVVLYSPEMRAPGVTAHTKTLFSAKDPPQENERKFGKMVKEIVEGVKPPYGPQEWAAVGYAISSLKESMDKQLAVYRATTSRESRRSPAPIPGQTKLSFGTPKPAPSSPTIFQSIRERDQPLITHVLTEWMESH